MVKLKKLQGVNILKKKHYYEIREIFNSVYNDWFSQFALKSLNEGNPLNNDDWIKIINQAQKISKKYKNTKHTKLVNDLLILLCHELEH